MRTQWYVINKDDVQIGPPGYTATNFCKPATVFLTALKLTKHNKDKKFLVFLIDLSKMSKIKINRNLWNNLKQGQGKLGQPGVHVPLWVPSRVTSSARPLSSSRHISFVDFDPGPKICPGLQCTSMIVPIVKSSLLLPGSLKSLAAGTGHSFGLHWPRRHWWYGSQSLSRLQPG